MISAGGTREAIAHAPHQVQGLIAAAAKASYVDALNTILLVGAGVAFVGMVVSLRRDPPARLPRGAEASGRSPSNRVLTNRSANRPTLPA